MKLDHSLRLRLVVDWDKPIQARSTLRGDVIPVNVDRTYASRVGQHPVKFPLNLWTEGQPGGTWYFNDVGIAVAGITPEGKYEGRFTIENR